MDADQNVCCGICGEVMLYDVLMNHHLPNVHPEVMADGSTDFEEVSYDVSLVWSLSILISYNSGMDQR